MVHFEFHCDASVLELTRDDVHVFIDLADLSKVATSGDAGNGLSSLPVYVDSADVRDLFSYYGCLEKCPV